MPYKTSIWVTFNVVGFHKWPDAPAKAYYLRSLHRHVFYFKVTISVPHPDRALEFHMFKDEVLNIVMENYSSLDIVEDPLYALVFDDRSCEIIAREVIDLIVSKYPGREIIVDVSEDGENGGVVSYTPEGE